MAPQRDSDRKTGLAWGSILIPLGLGFVLSLTLAYQAFDSGRQHRATARSAARDHAQFAAYLIASNVDQRLREALLYGFYPIDLAFGREGADLPPPSALRAEPEISRCQSESRPEDRHFFRLGPALDDILVDGPHKAAFAAWVATAADMLWDDDRETSFAHAVAEIAGRRSLVAYRSWARTDGRVVYGFESCWRSSAGNVFERAALDTQAFSPTLVGETPNDSLFTLAARDGGAELIFGERWTRPEVGLYGTGDFYGTVTLEPESAFGGAELRVTLLPQVVERLVEGGVPPSRLPLAFGLLALNAVLMWIAVRQLRRSHELVNLRAGFVRNVSHELRTPLQQILLFTDLLRSGRLDAKAKRSEALDIMHAETRRLIELVRNVLRFSGESEEKLRLAEVDLSVLVRETVEAFRPLAASRDAVIDIDERHRPQVRADEDAVKRILINLLDNAVKYGPEGQRIRVGLSADGDCGEVSVSDDGPGVPESDRDRIWEAFGRLDRDDRGASAGSGIGLSIVRRLADAMNARVDVEEDATGGARFTLRLPLEARAE